MFSASAMSWQFACRSISTICKISSTFPVIARPVQGSSFTSIFPEWNRLNQRCTICSETAFSPSNFTDYSACFCTKIGYSIYAYYKSHTLIILTQNCEQKQWRLMLPSKRVLGWVHRAILIPWPLYNFYGAKYSD